MRKVYLSICLGVCWRHFLWNYHLAEPKSDLIQNATFHISRGVASTSFTIFLLSLSIPLFCFSYFHYLQMLSGIGTLFIIPVYSIIQASVILVLHHGQLDYTELYFRSHSIALGKLWKAQQKKLTDRFRYRWCPSHI